MITELFLATTATPTALGSICPIASPTPPAWAKRG